MIPLFSSCKAALLGSELLVLLFVMTRIYDGASALSVLLLFIIGSVLCFVCVSLYAVIMHHRLLLVLYALQKPANFIHHYEPLLNKRPLAANVRFTMTAYLSNAYAAKGDFARARALLDQAPVLGRLRKAECRRLLTGNRISIALAEGNAQTAASLCDELELLINAAHMSAKKQAVQSAMLRTLRAQTAILAGSCTAEQAAHIRQEKENAQSAFRRTELSYFAGLSAIHQNDAAGARAYLSLAAQTKGETHYGNLAARMLSTLPESAHAGSKKKR